MNFFSIFKVLVFLLLFCSVLFLLLECQLDFQGVKTEQEIQPFFSPKKEDYNKLNEDFLESLKDLFSKHELSFYLARESLYYALISKSMPFWCDRLNVAVDLRDSVSRYNLEFFTNDLERRPDWTIELNRRKIKLKLKETGFEVHIYFLVQEEDGKIKEGSNIIDFPKSKRFHFYPFSFGTEQKTLYLPGLVDVEPYLDSVLPTKDWSNNYYVFSHMLAGERFKNPQGICFQDSFLVAVSFGFLRFQKKAVRFSLTKEQQKNLWSKRLELLFEGEGF